MACEGLRRLVFWMSGWPEKNENLIGISWEHTGVTNVSFRFEKMYNYAICTCFLSSVEDFPLSCAFLTRTWEHAQFYKHQLLGTGVPTSFTSIFTSILIWRTDILRELQATKNRQFLDLYLSIVPTPNSLNLFTARRCSSVKEMHAPAWIYDSQLGFISPLVV